jgi:hypothetical protein
MIDIERILLELDSIYPILKKIGKDNNQQIHSEYEEAFCLQSIEGCKDPYYATGSMSWYPHKESDFCNFVFPQLKYTNEVISELNLYRTRVMTLKPRSCLNFHYDNSPRIHIPLVTNDDCIFILENEILRFPADGNYYYVDTRKKHTGINASEENRIHIIGCVSA